MRTVASLFLKLCLTIIPVGCCIEAVVWQEVVVEFPEDVKGNATVRGQHVVVSLPEHCIVVV